MGIETISILLLAGFLLFLAAGVPMAFACGMLGVSLAYLEFGVPGLLLGGIYIAHILIRARLNPALASLVADADPPLGLGQKLAASKGLVGPILLVVVVLGSI
jgi:TRAP-type mannitol/chloroaromatic compound transport system permease large subunit